VKKFSSNYLYSQEGNLLSYAIIIVDNDEVLEVIDTGGVMREIAGLEFHSGLFIIGDIQMDIFDDLKSKKASFAALFEKVKYSNKSLFHLSNLDFENSCLNRETIFKRYL
jgi:hypothetical protein